MVSVMKAGADWCSIGLLSLLLVTSLCRGEIYDKRRMEPIEEHTATEVERCVRPLNSEAMLKVVLLVRSTQIGALFDAGISMIEGGLLSPLDTWHKLEIKHGVAEYRHILKVEMDNKTVAFNHTQKGQWFTTAYSYGKIQLSVKGKVEIVDCNLLAPTVGEMYDKQQMEPIEEYTATEVERCVRPLTSEAMMKVVLLVRSVAANALFDAGVSLVEWGVSPVEKWHPLEIRHGVADYRHILKVEMDNKTVAFNHTQKGQWFTTAYSYGKIQLSVKGKVEIADCNLLAATVEDSSWMWSLGGVGGVPVVPLTIVAVVVLAVAITLGVVWWRRKSQSKHVTSKAVRLDSIRHTGYEPIDTREEKGGNGEGPRENEDVVSDSQLDQMDDSYGPQMNHGRPLTSFSNSST